MIQPTLFDLPPHAPYVWNRSSIDGAKAANQTNAAKVLQFIREHGGATRREIEEGTGLKINVVCGRVDELKKRGLIHVDSKRPSPYGVEVEVLK